MDTLVFSEASSRDILSYIRHIVFFKQNQPVVSIFLQSVDRMLRRTISSLPASDREKLPLFTNLKEFLNEYEMKTYFIPVVDTTLLCIAQLADYISLNESGHEILSKYSAIFATSFGLISGATASILPQGVEGVALAVHAVEITLRIALHVASLADRISLFDPKKPEPWTVEVNEATDIDAQSQIDCFVQSRSLALSNRPYLSDIWPSGITISGPPEILQELHQLDFVLYTPETTVRSIGPVHAPHLYANFDIGRFIDFDLLRNYDPLIRHSRIPLLSIRDGAPYSAQSLTEFYETVITDLLKVCQNLRSILKCHREMHQSSGPGSRLLVLGPIEKNNHVLSTLEDDGKGDSNTIFDWRPHVRSSQSFCDQEKKERIAIVGFSGRFPGGSNLEEFWKTLHDGHDMHREVPPDRFDAQTYYDPTGKGKNKSHTPFGCFVENPGLFDPRFFNMSPREATQTDPMQRLALMTAYEALEMSGFVPNRTPSTRLDRIGTFYGQTSDDWREINESQDIDTYFITGGVRAFGPGRINYHFGFSGPSLNIDTACSSSMAAIHTACNSLWLQDCDTAIAGGVNIMTNPDIFSGLSKGQFLSKVGPCQTFDDAADGYCRGDGVGSLILKRFSDAQADNDTIYGFILSIATNHSADAISITHPHGKTQEILYRRVLAQAGIHPDEVSYVEMHGTGTQAGDATEMSSVTNVFAPLPRPEGRKLYLGSVKANIGHGEAASGVTALIKALLIMRHGIIPPHIGIKQEINRGFPDLAARNTFIPSKPVAFQQQESDTRRVFVNNFSAAGGNTALVLEDGPQRQLMGSDPRQTFVIAVSGRALSSLRLNLNSIAEHLKSHPEISMPSLSYTTTARKIHHSYRLSVVATDISTVEKALRNAAEKDDIMPVPRPPKVAFVFTGQGSMYSGVGADLFYTCTQYREAIVEFDGMATSFGFPSIRPFVEGSENRELSSLSPVLLQVAQVSIQMALVRFWKSLGVHPDLAIGHSLGEYPALFASGVISASDAIFLVGSRAQLLEASCTAGSHAMLAIQGDPSRWRDLVSADQLQIACMNSNSETVISGLRSSIVACQVILERNGIRATPINVPYAFHSSQVDAFLSSFEQICANITTRKPNIKLLSPLLGRPLDDSVINTEYFLRHAREAVNFSGALQTALSRKIVDKDTVFVEIGPHHVCSAFIKSTVGTSVAVYPSLERKIPPWDTLAHSTSGLHNKGVNLSWQNYHCDFETALNLVPLPSYSWALSNYWIDYQNDWCLDKGQSTLKGTSLHNTSPLSTTSVQCLVREEFKESHSEVVAETDILRPDCNEVLSGHMVNGVALCPSSFYGDIGMTIGRYMYKHMFNTCKEEEVPCISVLDMKVPKTLIAQDTGPQIITIFAKAENSKNDIKIRISSHQGDHATFTVQFGRGTMWLEEWKRMAHLVDARITALRDGAGRAHVLYQEMAYKLFASFVDYEKSFQGMKKVYLDSYCWEATADVYLSARAAEQKFIVPPQWIDSIGHLSGFVLNVQISDDSKKNVFVSHGWKSLRVAETLIPDKRYQTYVRMMEDSLTKLISGDVYCFDDSRVVALFEGVTFMRLPRAVLDQVLPRPRPSALVSRPMGPAKQREKNEIQVVTTHSTSSLKVESINLINKESKNTFSFVTQVLVIISEECGVDQTELADPNSFSDLGVDSLMQLAISSRIREELDIEIPSSLFIDHPTVGALKLFLEMLESKETSNSGSSSLSSDLKTDFSIDSDDESRESTDIHPDSSGINDSKDEPTKESFIPVVEPLTEASLMKGKRATSFLLQGNPKTATKKLFLFPDGGGSAASYAQIPSLSDDVVVFGLNSPFMTTPNEYTCGVSGMARYYLDEIRRRQSQGPYNFGGWSAGGVIAFEGAQQIIRLGEKVERLILIDAPCPLTIEPLPISLHRWFNSLGLLSNGEPRKTPVWLLPHFQASINALSTYNARAIDFKKAPTTYIIWCEDGVCKNPTDPRPDPYPYGHAQFLLENKEDLGPQLWDSMVGCDNLRISHIPGNHFTMMIPPFVELLGDRIRQAFD